jgi:ATP-dependent RNA helicase RhlE
MNSFENFRLSKQLLNAIDELGFDTPTPIQTEAFPVIMSGKDMVGIAQTGTGKTLAYMLPILHELKFSKQNSPRILVLVPTRELVIQVVDQFKSISTYLNVRVLGVYGGVNINTQKMAAAQGTDILVATPGRLYDLALSGSVQLKGISKLVIDEVDVMLDLGFRFQLKNIFELMPDRRQNIMFSATMTEEVDDLIEDFFIAPAKISIAVSGTPLSNIDQQCYPVKNFNTKVNLLNHLVSNWQEYRKVLVFVSNKKRADRLFETMEAELGKQVGIIHSDKTQSHRIKAISLFDKGSNRILVTTDVMARGLDLEMITHVINFDTPEYPENYMHRIGRTGRATQLGKSILFFTEQEAEAKARIEALMSYTIPQMEFPDEVTVSTELIPEERPKMAEVRQSFSIDKSAGAAFHEKTEKNTKTNQGGKYRRELAKKYKKPISRGDKNYNKHFKKK